MAGCCDGVSDAQLDQESTLIAEGRIVDITSHRLKSGVIVTDATMEPIEIFKGDHDGALVIRYLGGRVGLESQFSSQDLSLCSGMDYMLRLVRRGEQWQCLEIIAKPTGSWSEERRVRYRKARKLEGKSCLRRELSTTHESFSLEGGYSSPMALSQAASSGASAAGYSSLSGVPGRFTNCDDGSPILYQVDTELLPTGISRAKAMQAVKEAFAAWSEVSGLVFEFERNTNFGKSSAEMSNSGERLFIQLHDKYDYIPGTSTFGIGGGGIITSGSYPNGGLGGNVAGQEFHKRTKGYVILNHRSEPMDTYSTFVEVLTHEIGHTLGLRHSSESANEQDINLANALMYFQTHADGRGASLTSYDIDHINFAYPRTNMPPTGHDRIMYPVTGSPQPTGLGVDRVTIQGSDRETPENLGVEVLLASATQMNGSFSVPEHATIKYTPAAVFSDFSLSDDEIASDVFYDRIAYRITDGVNKSPHYFLRVVGMNKDTTPVDGLPDTWVLTHFDTTSPALPGEAHHPDSDPDGDRLSNRLELFYGSDPHDSRSGNPEFQYDHANRTASWQSMRYMPYILQCSEDLSHWTTIQAIAGDGALQTVKLGGTSARQLFYRVLLKP